MKRILSIILLGSPLWLLGQTLDNIGRVNFSGQVIDEHDAEPLGFATIYIVELDKGITTDSAGNFSFIGLPKGEFTVKISHLGCEPLVTTVDLSRSKEQEFFLEHHSELLEQIVVQEEHIDQPLTQAKIELSKEEVRLAGGKTLAEMVSSVEGVTLLRSGPGITKPVIHGMYGNRILIIDQGVRLEAQQWGADHAPALDPFLSDKVSVVKGAAAVRYGADAIAGVILLESEPLPNSKELSGTVTYVGESNGLSNTGALMLKGGSQRLKGFGWRIHGNYKRRGDLEAPNYVLSNTGAQEGNASIALGYRKWRYGFEVLGTFYNTTIGVLRSAHIGNLTDLETALASNEPWQVEDRTFAINSPSQQVSHSRLLTKGFFQIKEQLKLEWTYGFQQNNRKEFDVRRGGRSDEPAVDLSLQTHTMEVTLKNPAYKRWQTLAGVSAKFQKNTNDPDIAFRPIIPNYGSATTGIFVVEHYHREKWELEAGARYDYTYFSATRFDRSNIIENVNLQYHNVSATVGVLVKPVKGLQLRSNVGTAFRPPNAAELFSEGVRQTAAAIEEGDVSLDPEKGIKWISTAAYEWKDRFKIQVSTYYQYLPDHIYLQPQQEPRLTIRGAFPVFSYVQTDAQYWGIDAATTIQIYKDLALNVKYALVRAKDRISNAPLILIPADRIEASLRYQKNLKKDNNLYFLTSVQQVWEQTRAPAEQDFAAPPEAYFLLNAGIGMSISMKHKRILHIDVGGENLLNQTYRDYLDRLRYFADAPGRNVSLRLKYSFT